MADLSPDYKQLYFEALQEAQKREQLKHKYAGYTLEYLEASIRKTTLFEFLDASHCHLHASLTVQMDAPLWTQGDPANANNKFRPQRLRFWDDFPMRQERIWEEIMVSGFALERHFTSMHALSATRKATRYHTMRDEIDLLLFQWTTVEEPVSWIIKQMHNNRALKRKFGLRGSMSFENHANKLSPEREVEEGIQNLSAKADASPLPEPSAAVRNGASRSSRPRADQFCVYNMSEETRSAAFVIDYKMPHEIPLGYIYEGLEDMDLDDVVDYHEGECTRDRFRRLIAAIVTQAFSYMVQVGVEYGCICTGEANIFLRIPHDPTTVYYFLSVPKGDVGNITGWMPDADGPNRLHLTALGQMLAFTLQALKTPPRSQKWREETCARLKSWEFVYRALSTEYRPPRDTRFFRVSPVRLRQRRPRVGSSDCSQYQEQHSASDEEPDPDMSSRQPPSLRQPSRTQSSASDSLPDRQSRHVGNGGQYCTQNCMLGLVKGGSLDFTCPNVKRHGTHHHLISLTTFLKRIRKQLARDLDRNCDPIGLHGACGVPFCVRLDSHGYTVVAKACPTYFVYRLRWEATVYDVLRPIQGTHVPVYLGNVDLEVPYYYEGIAELVHMMFLSYGGKRMDKQLASADKPFALQQADNSAQAIRALGVSQNDLALRNMLWDADTRRVMVVDFERAEFCATGTLRW
ncbi:hypothetical protein BU25DRAFT_440232 [Macroventuria anomochaeta]|uniref:Uncharacterized protein n=1 Tax=Macroventuria anomochaeta TaxID=301207 RepID=A0ACB6S0R9_9PLEO|nr:uncharacterized protein BU25DRAFT_440232 [Macroventuria anomochaeta]KAF2626984.1 hypothetical protein BU25DRAFT_440232 [Macroventuria anomochaeta]